MVLNLSLSGDGPPAFSPVDDSGNISDIQGNMNSITSAGAAVPVLRMVVTNPPVSRRASTSQSVPPLDLSQVDKATPTTTKDEIRPGPLPMSAVTLKDKPLTSTPIAHLSRKPQSEHGKPKSTSRSSRKFLFSKPIHESNHSSVLQRSIPKNHNPHPALHGQRSEDDFTDTTVQRFSSSYDDFEEIPPRKLEFRQVPPRLERNTSSSTSSSGSLLEKTLRSSPYNQVLKVNQPMDSKKKAAMKPANQTKQKQRSNDGDSRRRVKSIPSYNKQHTVPKVAQAQRARIYSSSECKPKNSKTDKLRSFILLDDSNSSLFEANQSYARGVQSAFLQQRRFADEDSDIRSSATSNTSNVLSGGLISHPSAHHKVSLCQFSEDVEVIEGHRIPNYPGGAYYDTDSSFPHTSMATARNGMRSTFPPSSRNMFNKSQPDHRSVKQKHRPMTFGTAPRTDYSHTTHPDNSPMKPKVVTVVRAGQIRPHKKITILLNRRAVQTYEQLVSDISEALGQPKWKNDHIRRLYTLKGREIRSVSDFFREDDVFIAVGREQLTTMDVQEVLQELYPDSPYAESLIRQNLQKAYRQQKQGRRGFPEQGKGSKSDSGLGDSTEGDRRFQNDGGYRGPGAGRGRAAHIVSERRRFQEEERIRAKKWERGRWEREQEELDEELRRRHGNRDPVDDEASARERERKKKERIQWEAEERERQRRKQVEDEERRRRETDEKRERDRIRREREAEEREKIKRLEQDLKREKLKEEAERKRRHREEEEKQRRRREEDEERRRREELERERKRLEDEKRQWEEEKRRQREEEERRKNEERARQEQEKREKAKREREEEERRRKEEERHHHDDYDKSEKTSPTHYGQKSDDTDRIRRVQKFKAPTRTIMARSNIEARYEIGKTIGDGNFAVVKECRLRNTESEFAMKIIDKSKLKGKEDMIENEIAIMKNCHHPNIVRLIEEFETENEIYLVLEYVKGGDLFDAITESVKFTERDAANMVADLSEALAFLHSKNIIHRDLKPENLLVSRNKDGSMTLKLADFGLAMEVTEPIYTVCGTPTYVAPEILAETGYGLEVDMWATGVITYILLCGFPPFRSLERDQEELFEIIQLGDYEFLSPYWDNISEAAKDLIQRLLVVDTKRRYTAEQVLSHPWIQSEGTYKGPNLQREITMNLEKNFGDRNRRKAGFTQPAAVH
nr:serine/threonine-protein kinase DCLK3 isoform X1 [Ciona intestinalis]|eukprot:XP_026690786.1 serine/threonine-protein kinase DCLK3 isoform X1 [Ciona intestinalis]